MITNIDVQIKILTKSCIKLYTHDYVHIQPKGKYKDELGKSSLRTSQI